MISHIEIKDFAVIKNLNLDLNSGLNILTGETGSGKSVIIEAISMGLGGRADTDYIRNGCDKASISILIDNENDQFSLKREISAGKSVCRINGELVSVSQLSNFCKGLVDIHGQYDHQSLLNPDNHITILDLYGGEEIAAAQNKVFSVYEKYASASKKLMEFKKALSDSERQKDYLRFELDEIRKANLKPGEDESLEKSIDLMKNSEEIFKSLSNSYGLLAGDDRGVYSLLGEVLNNLESIKAFSEDINEIYDRVSNAYYELEDIYHDVRNIKDNIVFSESELDSAISRLDLINRLKKKYGCSIEEILEYADNSAKKLELYENSSIKQKELEQTLIDLKQQYDTEAKALSSLRKETAKRIISAVNKELSELNFNNAEFGVFFADCTPKENGTDLVEFLIRTNKGEEQKSLAKIASGGELSRIMLALKRIIGDIDDIPTMIFDEIDTGVSGASAAIVGEKLKSISANHQVICITHLPQIASMGDYHYKISKSSDDTSTMTNVQLLSEGERVEEIARLLSGATISDTARAQAAELLGK